MEDPRILEDGPHGTIASRERTYADFLTEKSVTVEPVGFHHDIGETMLFPFQAHITKWALRRGRAAVFADCGLGKTPIQLEWAKAIMEHECHAVLIVAPLAVSEQTVREGIKFDVPVTICKDGKVGNMPGIFITNYERLHLFNPSDFRGIVLDESSILKSMTGTRKGEIVDFASTIPYRLACTATPAPNDYVELCNHAEFLGIMNRKEVQALFFTQDGNSTANWRLKGHAQIEFWTWMSSWAVACRRPSDLGYHDDGFILPKLTIKTEYVDYDFRPDGALFTVEAIGLAQQRQVMRDTLDQRVARTAEIVNAEPGPWIVWCNLNKESEALVRAIDGAVEVTGSMHEEEKARRLLAFSNGEIDVLVTKPRIGGFGMNWQHCARVAFVGLSHSYEQFYQAVRRTWRFGQKREVVAHIIAARPNQRIAANIARKEKQSNKIMQEVITYMNDAGQLGTTRHEAAYVPDVEEGEGWKIHLGDCIDVTKSLEDNSVGLSVFSPPFPGMYVYSNSERDMGNTHKIPEMIEHMRYLVRPLLQKTMPARHCCIHLTQGTSQKARDGHVGLRDFRGQVIHLMEEEGWIYYGEVCIDKNPQVKAVRTKDRGLLFKTLANDASHLHMALADYLLQFRKPGDSTEPIRAGISEKYDNPDGWITADEWIRWARPVWYGADFAPDGDGIRETDTLNVVQARETNDERHLAPLQLGVIERAIKLWSNPGDLVFDPFTGVGSTGYVALQNRRRFVGAELKASYHASACRNLRAAVEMSMQGTLFA